ncbi:hypothetical protein TNCV_4816381 [Trichonephila clavipes]|nr:hypothetical protein TNCV_4816381 [Trichonephila clavipes]
MNVDLWTGREKKKRKIGMARKRAENREGSLGFPGSVSSGTPKRGTTNRLTGADSLLPPVYSEAWAKENAEVSLVINLLHMGEV